MDKPTHSLAKSPQDALVARAAETVNGVRLEMDARHLEALWVVLHKQIAYIENTLATVARDTMKG